MPELPKNFDSPLMGDSVHRLVVPLPCDCRTWARTFDGTYDKGTNHHPRCPHVDDSLIDVWKIGYDGDYYFESSEPDYNDLHPDSTVTKERMHKELFDRLPEFSGF